MYIYIYTCLCLCFIFWNITYKVEVEGRTNTSGQTDVRTANCSKVLYVPAVQPCACRRGWWMLWASRHPMGCHVGYAVQRAHEGIDWEWWDDGDIEWYCRVQTEYH